MHNANLRVIVFDSFPFCLIAVRITIERFTHSLNHNKWIFSTRKRCAGGRWWCWWRRAWPRLPTARRLPSTILSLDEDIWARAAGPVQRQTGVRKPSHPLTRAFNGTAIYLLSSAADLNNRRGNSWMHAHLLGNSVTSAAIDSHFVLLLLLLFLLVTVQLVPVSLLNNKKGIVVVSNFFGHAPE